MANSKSEVTEITEVTTAKIVKPANGKLLLKLSSLAVKLEKAGYQFDINFMTTSIAVYYIEAEEVKQLIVDSDLLTCYNTAQLITFIEVFLTKVK